MRGWTLALLGSVVLCSGCGEQPKRTAAKSAAPAPPPPPPPPGAGGQAVPPPPTAAPPKAAAFSDAVLTQKAAESREKLKRIGEALIQYHNQHRRFPPAYATDPEGKPLFSWRVHLLPQLGRQDLFDRFDKTKAWDAPENLPISNEALDFYKSPGDPNVANNGANYVGILGDGTFFQAPKAIGMAQVRDGLMYSVSVVELKGIAGSWAAPIDPRMDGMQWSLGNGPGQLASPYPKFLNVVFADGGAKALTADVVPKVFPQLITVADGKPVQLW